MVRNPGVSESPVLCLVFPVWESSEDTVFCSPSVTRAYCVGGQKLSSQALSTCMFLFFFHLFFIIQKKGQGKERKKVKGHWRNREIEAD